MKDDYNYRYDGKSNIIKLNTKITIIDFETTKYLIDRNIRSIIKKIDTAVISIDNDSYLPYRYTMLIDYIIRNFSPHVIIKYKNPEFKYSMRHCETCIHFLNGCTKRGKRTCEDHVYKPYLFYNCLCCDEPLDQLKSYDGLCERCRKELGVL